MKLQSHYILLLSMLLCACTPKYMSEEELQKFVLENSELSKKREFKGYEIQLYYKPTDLLIAQELGGELAKSKEELERLQQKYANHEYFILSLSKNNKEALYQMGNGFDQFSEIVQTLSFNMGNYVNSTTSGKDTVEIDDYVFPRTYGMGMSTNIMFVFSKEKSKDDEWIQVNIKEFGMGLGNQVFRFKREELENLPSINFKVNS